MTTKEARARARATAKVRAKAKTKYGGLSAAAQKRGPSTPLRVEMTVFGVGEAVPFEDRRKNGKSKSRRRFRSGMTTKEARAKATARATAKAKAKTKYGGLSAAAQRAGPFDSAQGRDDGFWVVKQIPFGNDKKEARAKATATATAKAKAKAKAKAEATATAKTKYGGLSAAAQKRASGRDDGFWGWVKQIPFGNDDKRSREGQEKKRRQPRQRKRRQPRQKKQQQPRQQSRQQPRQR